MTDDKPQGLTAAEQDEWHRRLHEPAPTPLQKLEARVAQLAARVAELEERQGIAPPAVHVPAVEFFGPVDSQAVTITVPTEPAGLQCPDCDGTGRAEYQTLSGVPVLCAVCMGSGRARPDGGGGG